MALFDFNPATPGFNPAAPNPMQQQGMGSMGGLLGNPLLNIGLGILANNYGNYGNLGVALGRGAQQGIQNTMQSQQFARQQQLADLQMKQAQAEMAERQKRQNLISQLPAAIAGREIFRGPFREAKDAVAKPNVDEILMQIDPIAYYQSKQKEKSQPIKLSKGESLYDPNTYAPLISAPQEMEAPKTRTVRIGNQEVTQEWNPQEGKWSEVGRGAAFKSTPDVVTNVNAFPKETFKNERDLRNDFQSLPTTKAFREVQTSYDQITTALKNPSAANDLAAATKFMKLLDPGSVVRESELGMAMAATGQLDRMSNYFNMMKTGQKLTPSQRKDFADSATQLYSAAAGRYNETASEFQNLAKDYELNPERIAKPIQVPKASSISAGGWSARKVP